MFDAYYGQIDRRDPAQVLNAATITAAVSILSNALKITLIFMNFGVNVESQLISFHKLAEGGFEKVRAAFDSMQTISEEELLKKYAKLRAHINSHKKELKKAVLYDISMLSAYRDSDFEEDLTVSCYPIQFPEFPNITSNNKTCLECTDAKWLASCKWATHVGLFGMLVVEVSERMCAHSLHFYTK